MASAPDALDPGTVLHDRFVVGGVLGRGGFGITYEAEDLERRDLCVVKELAPPGSVRIERGDLSFADIGPASGQRLRHQFLREAKFLGRLRIPGVIPIRTTWQEHGTSYYAMDLVPRARSLQKVLLSDGRMDADAVRMIVLRLLTTIEGIHGRGLLHRDIKPSNVLIDDRLEAYLIDFGSAREWHADLTSLHTVQFTPGYAPLEQMSEQARRGPATDLYGLCALAYALLTGEPPAPAVERAAGMPLIPLRSVRPDVDPLFAAAVEHGLALRYEDRPPSAAALRALIEAPPASPLLPHALDELDERLIRLQRFKFGKRECPGCGGVLEDPKPLRPNICPVCQRGVIRPRRISAHLCPLCRVGFLQPLGNAHELRLCPSCRFGVLPRIGRLRPKKPVACPDCRESFTRDRGLWTRTSDGESKTAPEWAAEMGRSADVRRCDGCGAQFDRLVDGRLAQVLPAPKEGQFGVLFDEEWARVAAGLEPGAGNAVCEACDADYFTEGPTITLLAAGDDPFGFADRHLGQLLRLDRVPWLAVGKTSGKPGLSCRSCDTEFDGHGDPFVLVASTHPDLRIRIGESLTLANWHRIAKGLPLFGEESELTDAMPGALLEAYLDGHLPFDSRDPSVVWRGGATRMEDRGGEYVPAGSGQLTIDADDIVFGGLLRKQRIPLDQVEGVELREGFLVLTLTDGGASAFELESVSLVARLESGAWETTLDVEALFTQLRARLGQAAEVS